MLIPQVTARHKRTSDRLRHTEEPMRTQSTATQVAEDGTTFRLVGWPSPTPTDVAVVVHHGLGEHAGRYETLARGLGDAPVHLWGWDARGHGHSTGKRGHATGLDQMIGDLEHLLPAVLERSGASRAILYGHSMGAAVTARYFTHHTPDPRLVGAWFSSTALKVELNGLEMQIKAAVAPILASLAPSFALANGLDANGISSVPAEVERYQKDPLVHDRLSAALGNSMLRDPPQSLAQAARLSVPVLMWHGDQDSIADIEGTRAFFNGAGSHDKTFREIAGARHEVHHESEAITGPLFRELREWIAQRFPPTP